MSSPLFPKKLAIYYGWPGIVNSATNPEVAAKEFAKHDLVVFGDGLENPKHAQHKETVAMIKVLKAKPQPTAVFGYIPLGQNTSAPLTAAAIQSDILAWKQMGVAGIFLDQAGYDFGCSRQLQSKIIKLIHSLKLRAFVNAWNPDDVFGPAFDAQWNPSKTATLLGPNDIYLNEGFQITCDLKVPTYPYQNGADWFKKSNKAFAYKSQFGTQMATVTTTNLAPSAFDQAQFDYAWYSTLIYGFDAMGWGEADFSAQSSQLPYRNRPDPGDIGMFTPPPPATSSAVTHWGVGSWPVLNWWGDWYYRTTIMVPTSKGCVWVETLGHKAGFAVLAPPPPPGSPPLPGSG